MKTFLRISSLALFLGLISCSTVPPVSTTQTTAAKPANWDNRVQNVAHFDRWNIKGQVAVRTSKGSDSASIDWQQNKQNYSMSLFGPLGSNSYKLYGHPGKVTLVDSKGKSFSAGSAEELLQKQTGWRLPVSNLYYWVRALPVPGLPATKRFDANNHLVQMNQGGWSIQYLRYTPVRNTDLPNKIFINSAGLNVKLIISDWQIG